ncbi:hypothetical protein GCM10017083_04930 [Thalassobaculum fulvum]|uniref:HNH endonuclease n=1 Tax=Thalassobaculum fulvum TaxID=1633335 RepID=A0A918XP22_9PROT|nr:hypothetical protein [Thalassobaculum fulvum]GHD41045.1 hypothetical protein GCM10017083_04930 [Thalassobaculum fulvum]
MTDAPETAKGTVRTSPSTNDMLDPSSPDFDIVAWFDRPVPPETEEHRQFRLAVLRSIHTGDRPEGWPANQNVPPDRSSESPGERQARLFREKQARRALEELWRPAKVWHNGSMLDLSPLYVSSQGRVIACDRRYRGGYGRDVGNFNKILKRVQIERQINAERVVTYRYRIVLSTFVGAPPGGRTSACHADGDPTNDALSNLRWDSQAGNCQDTIRHGRTPRGQRHPGAKLSEAQALEVVKAVVANAGPLPFSRLREFAERFGCSATAIKAINYRKTWLHLYERVDGGSA